MSKALSEDRDACIGSSLYPKKLLVFVATIRKGLNKAIDHTCLC